jgi:beta-xylosidase
MNQDGWPVVAPYRYTGERLETINQEDIPGEYQFINHEKDITKYLKKAVNITLNPDGTITGAVSGTWELVDDYYANIVIDGKTYKGVFLRQWTELTEKKDITFTALSDEGKTIWGIRRYDHKSIQQDKIDETNEPDKSKEPENDKEAKSTGHLDLRIPIIVAMVFAVVTGLIFLKNRIFPQKSKREQVK